MASSARPMIRNVTRIAQRAKLPARAPHTVTREFLRPQSFRRTYASSARNSSSYSNDPPLFFFGGLGAVLAVAGGAALHLANQQAHAEEPSEQAGSETSTAPETFTPTYEDYEKVYRAIAKRLEEQDWYEDGSFGPVVLRLAWHASGTYDKATGTGGSNGATMRFAPEAEHGANSGLAKARDFLEPLKQQFPWITYADLWTLAGVAAVQEMQGPLIPWRPGRQDRDAAFCAPDGRLPDGGKAQDHLRAIFGRMGFSDAEIVALSGAHALGRCHAERSGFDGPWTFSPTVVTNDYFRLLLDEEWRVRDWDGPRQFQDAGSRSLMMLPTDVALVQDDAFRPHVERYAASNEAFFEDFGGVVCKLFELGVPFERDERWTFKPLYDEE